MHLYHFYHRHHQKRQHHKSPFWLFELSIWLHMLARALFAVFIPIFLLKLGYTIGEVIVYYLLYHLIDLPLNIVAKSFVQKYGARLIIVLATLLMVLFLALFLSLTPNNWPLLVGLAVVAAMYDTLYWVAYIFFFIRSDSQDHAVGKSTGILHAVRKSAGLLGPALGAFLLVFVSQQVLFFVTMGVFLLSLWPLFLLKDFPDKPQQASLTLRQFFADKEGRREFIATGLYAIHDIVESTLFPLFIFMVYGTIESVALVPVIVSVTAIVIALLMGNLRPKKRHIALIIGAVMIGFIWLARLVIDQGVLYYASVSAVGIFTYFILVPLDTGIFEHARRVGDPLSAATYRNIAYIGMYALLFAVLAVLVNVFHVSFVIAAFGLFVLAGVEMAAVMLWGRKKNALQS